MIPMIPFCVLAIEDDDDRAFMTFLVENYGRLVYSSIRKITKDNWDVDDIYQGVWEKLVNEIEKLRGFERDQRVNYLIVTARNRSLNYVRDKGRRRESSYEDDMDASDFKDAGSLAELRLIRGEESAGLARIWSKLDERSKYILEGYYVLEKPMEELAQGLEIKPASVRMALTRARKAAYKLLDEELEPQK